MYSGYVHYVTAQKYEVHLGILYYTHERRGTQMVAQTIVRLVLLILQEVQGGVSERVRLVGFRSLTQNTYAVTSFEA